MSEINSEKRMHSKKQYATARNYLEMKVDSERSEQLVDENKLEDD